MADIRPFRGVHYNESRIDDWSEVICPPYDIISSQQQEGFYERNEFNYIRIEAGFELPQDTSSDNRYTRSSATMKSWLEQGILKVDNRPSLYLHDHYFTWRGRVYKRRNLLARVRLEEWEKMVVRPHEGTLKNAKSDRLSLLFAMEANTSPVLSMYEDSGMQIASLLNQQAQRTPLVSTREDAGERHDMWVISDPTVIEKIHKVMENRPLYIADGHHRYESALAYRNERRIEAGDYTGEEAWNFVMMELVEFSDPGLIVLAPHRLVRGIPKSTLEGLYSNLQSLFKVEKLSIRTEGVWDQVEDLLARTKKVRLALYGIDEDSLYILTLEEPAAVSKMMPYFHSEMYRRLDVSIVDHVILENLLTLHTEKEKDSLAFCYDMNDAIRRVSMQEYQLAVLLGPVRPENIKNISDQGDKMPRKSTYFYPKTPCGLVINRLND